MPYRYDKQRLLARVQEIKEVHQIAERAGLCPVAPERDLYRQTWPVARDTEEVSCRDRIGYASQMDGTASFANREIGRALSASRLKGPFSPAPPNMRMNP
jgi:hypothetical protein